MGGCCGGLNERGPLRLTDLMLISQLVNLVEGGLGGAVSLDVGFQVSKTHTRPSSLSLPRDQDVKLSAAVPALCLPAHSHHTPCHGDNGLPL